MKTNLFSKIGALAAVIVLSSTLLLGCGQGEKPVSKNDGQPAPLTTSPAVTPLPSDYVPRTPWDVRLGGYHFLVPGEWTPAYDMTESQADFYMSVQKGNVGSGFISMQCMPFSDIGFHSMEERNKNLKGFYEALEKRVFTSPENATTYFEMTADPVDLTVRGEPARKYSVILHDNKTELYGEMLTFVIDTNCYAFFIVCPQERVNELFPLMHDFIVNEVVEKAYKNK